MPHLRLVIGPKNYSSWSLRPWLALKASGLTFEEIGIRFDTPTADEEIRRYSPTGKVPILLHGGRTVWETLSICEYVNELAPAAGLWPEARDARAVARSVSAEMYSRFDALRSALPMNLRTRRTGFRWGSDVQAEIDRIRAIWRTCRAEFGAGGPMLFGRFTIADAMYAPVVGRFVTYGVELDGLEKEYADAVWSLPDMFDWRNVAEAEPDRIPEYEVGT
jgi:glutathione S-transferase